MLSPQSFLWTLFYATGTNIYYVCISHRPFARYVKLRVAYAPGIPGTVIGIDTKNEVIVVTPTTWEAHHSPSAKPSVVPRSLVTPRWPESMYQFLFYHDASKHIKSMQIRVCISRKSLIKQLKISHYGKHGHRLLSQQLPWLRLGYHFVVTVMPVSLNIDNILQRWTG